MPEAQLFKTERRQSLPEISRTLASVADQLESGSVDLESPESSRTVAVPDEPTFEVELERATDPETGETRFELEFELSWTE